MPQRGKTPKRIGRVRTPRSALKAPQVLENGSPYGFRTPKIPQRVTRSSTKTPGWSSPTEDTFKLPMFPSPNRRVTRRSTVFKLPQYSSFVPIELSPRRTRRSSVYQKKDGTGTKDKDVGRGSSVASKSRPVTSSRRRSVAKKIDERLVDNLTDSKIVQHVRKPPKPVRFSPIKTRRQSMLPKPVNIQTYDPVVVHRTKVRDTAENRGKKNLPRCSSSLQKPTMSSAAKAKVKSKSPTVVTKANSNPEVEPLGAKKLEELVFVNDLVCLSPDVPKVVLQKVPSDIVLSARSARTKTRARSVMNTGLMVEKSDVTGNSKKMLELNETQLPIQVSEKTATRNTKPSKSPSSVVLESFPMDAEPSVDSNVQLEREERSEDSGETTDQLVLKEDIVAASSRELQDRKLPVLTGSQSVSDGTSCNTRSTKTLTAGMKRRLEETPKVAAKRAKMDNSVYATPDLQSPHTCLRNVVSEVSLSPATPEFRTPIGGNGRKKGVFRKGTPMRPGIQEAMRITRSTPSLNVNDTKGIQPTATRRMGMGKLEKGAGEGVVAPVINGKDVFKNEVLEKANGLDCVDADSIKEPLELVKKDESKKESRGRCIIL